MTDKNSAHSTLRERIVEHVFVGDVLRTLWCANITDIEVLRSEFDAHGYDIVMTRGPIVRHIQLKTGTSRKPSNVSVSTSLADKVGGCVIWIHVTPELDLGPYYWFGAPDGAALPSLARYPNALRATRNKQGIRPTRVNHRLVPGRDFQLVPSLNGVLRYLFSDLALPKAVPLE